MTESSKALIALAGENPLASRMARTISATAPDAHTLSANPGPMPKTMKFVVSRSGDREKAVLEKRCLNEGSPPSTLLTHVRPAANRNQGTNAKIQSKPTSRM